ncbi:MAG TPA: hypothetical protein VGK04_12775 [Thermoanaerobaculia bacterium]|jgi:hypothetical protein
MKKSLALFAFVFLLCSQAFAVYIVVLKDGTRYKAKTKWTISNGKALVTLESGQVMALNPNEIDVAKSEEMTKMGMGDVTVFDVGGQQPTQTQKPQQGLGSTVRLRKMPPAATPAVAPSGPAMATPGELVDQVDSRVRNTFERAYENVGIFEHKLSGTNRNIRVELTADLEDKVFNAISATAFLIVRNAGVENTQIEMVELFMKTTNGGAAGRFQMNRADADSINSKAITLQDYFVRKVIY